MNTISNKIERTLRIALYYFGRACLKKILGVGSNLGGNGVGLREVKSNYYILSIN